MASNGSLDKAVSIDPPVKLSFGLTVSFDTDAGLIPVQDSIVSIKSDQKIGAIDNAPDKNLTAKIVIFDNEKSGIATIEIFVF